MSSRLPGCEGNAVSMSPLRSVTSVVRQRLALLAFFALSAGLAGPLWAATGNVSNLSLSPSDGFAVTETFPSALAFTTGNHSAGYTLKSVTLKLKRQRAGGSPTYTVAELYSTSSENPGTSLATISTLNISDANAMADYVFSCTGSGCELESGTTYFIVVKSAREVVWGQNTSGSETNTPSDAGWSIADVAKYKSGSNWAEESPAVAKLMKVSWATPTLTASSIEATSATLGLANYSGNWYYKYTTPSGGQCSTAVSGASTSVTLTSGTSYTFKAYSDSNCTSTNELDSTTLLTKPGKAAGVSATAGNTSLAVSWTATTGAASYKIQWKSGTQEYDATNRQTTSTTASKTLSTLVNGTAYTLRVAAVNATGDGAWSDDATGTPAAPPTLTAGNVTATGARLTLANHTGTWYVRRTAPSPTACLPVTNSTFINVVETGNGAAYTYTAYSDACTTALDSVTFTTLNLATDYVAQTTAVLWLANHGADWYYKRTSPADPACAAVASGGTGSLSGLTASTSYTYEAYSDSSCATKIASHSFTTLGPVDLWVENITPNGAQIKLHNYHNSAVPEAWSYKLGPAGGSAHCYSMSRPRRGQQVGTALTGLAASTQYTISAHQGANCDGNSQWDSETFTTLAANAQLPTLSVSAIGSTTATLNLANHTGDWWYANDLVAGSCTKVDSGTSATNLSSLQANKAYYYTAYGTAGCLNSTSPISWWDQVTFNTTGPISATVTDYTSSQVTLAVSGIVESKWSYLHRNSSTKKFSSCTTHDASTTSVIVWGLTSGTPYEFRVYRGAGCAWTDRVTVNAHTISLSASSVGPSSATLKLEHYKGEWYHQQAGGSGAQAGASGGLRPASLSGNVRPASLSGGCSAASGATASLTGLTPDTEYTWNAYKDADCAKDVIASTSFTTRAAGHVAADLQPGFGSATVADQAYRQGNPIDSLTLPAADGGDGELTYTLAPALPAGLDFDAATRTLSGTPTAAQPATPYTYTATDADDDRATLTFTMTVEGRVEGDLQPAFGAHTIDDQSYAQHRAIEPLSLPAASGGNGPLTYALTPDPPAGLTFDAATRTLSGTPTTASPATAYTYTATTANGDSATLTFRITVAANSAPSFAAGVAIDDQVYTQNAVIEPSALPEVEGGNAPLIYALQPDPPAGLTFDAATRMLSGEPTEARPARAYTYTATDDDGDRVSLTFTIAVEADLSPDFGGAAIDDRTYHLNAGIEPAVLPAASGGDGALSYALTPALPAGLRFDAATRTLSGTPTAAAPTTPYTYTATDADGDRARLTFTLEVVVSTMEKAIIEDGLAAQGRALLSGATGVIGERFRNPGASSLAGVGECAGETPKPDDGGTGSRPADCTTGLLNTVAQAMLGLSGAGGRASAVDADDTRPRGPRSGAQAAWDWESLVWGRSFAVPLNAQGAPGSAWTLWGAGDIQGFRGDPRQGNYDGQVRSLYLGVDAQWQEQWLAGAALAQSWGETDYQAGPGGSAGQLETTLTSIYPYVRGTLGAGLEMWAIGGYGRGEAETTPAGATGAGATRDLTMAMGATGARQPMTEVGGVQLAVVGGAGYLSLATEEGTAAVADVDVAVQRARLAVEATGTAGGLTPYVQVGGRYDGGAGQTGAGLETVAGLRYTSERLEFEARGRWLAAHAAEGYEEYGGLARLAVKPLADGTGFRMAVAPRWGAAEGAGLLGGGAALLDGGAMPGLGVNGMPSATTRALMLESELGYGVAVFERQGVLAPYGGFALTGEQTRQYRLGVRLGMAQWLNLSLEGSRRESTGPQPADQGVQLQLEGRF